LFEVLEDCWLLIQFWLVLFWGLSMWDSSQSCTTAGTSLETVVGRGFQELLWLLGELSITCGFYSKDFHLLERVPVMESCYQVEDGCVVS
jgi:hypothetical protein